MRIQSQRGAALLTLAALASLACGRSVAGNVTFYSVYKNISYQQTSNSTPTTPYEFFVNGGVSSDTANDLTGGSFSYAGPNSPVSLAVTDPTDLGFAANFGSRAAMDAAFPDGTTYAFSVNTVSSPTTRNGTLPTPSTNLFTPNIPVISNFSQLQGLNPAAPFTVTFPGTTPTSGSNFSATYFTVFGAISSGGLSDSATSFLIPAGTLQPNTTYSFELDYSNRLLTQGNGDLSSGTAIAGYEIRTDGTFTTGPAIVPEPAGLTLAGVCIGGLALRTWRRRAGVGLGR